MSFVDASLVLADGSVFEGELLGAVPASGIAAGEVVFNTVLSGYQEVITDPSYAGQIITFTNPHIGNYGVNRRDFESVRPFCRGIVVREMARRYSNQRAQAGLGEMLARYGISGIGGLDTRRLTRLLRDTGAMAGAFGTASEAELRAAVAQAESGTEGVDLVAEVTTEEAYTVHDGNRSVHRTIVAYDFGIKHTILRQLSRLGTVHVVPASTSAADVLAMSPDGVFLSNGPGDPAQVPLRGVGHRRPARQRAGVRHLPRPPAARPGARRRDLQAAVRPPRRQPAGARTRPPATSRSPARTTTSASLPTASPATSSVTHVNLNDGTNEGMRHATPRRSACSTTPRPVPARTTAATCSPTSPR